MSERPRRANSIGAVGNQVRANLAHIRQSRGLSTTALAAKATALGRPMHATGITKIEKGVRRVDVDDLAALASVLGVTPAQLLEPPTDCGTCHGTPPPGFACTECDTTTTKEPT